MAEEQLRALRLAHGDGDAQAWRPGRGQGPGEPELEEGGSGSARKAKAPCPARVERRQLHRAKAGARQPCLELRRCSTRTHDRRVLRLLTLIDGFTRECLAFRVARPIGAQELTELLAEVTPVRRVPEHMLSNNALEFIPRVIRDLLAGKGARTLYIEPGPPWKNG